MTSAILSNLAETYPEVLKNPEKYLGPNYLNVLEFWEKIENLSEQERGGIAERFWNLDYNVRYSAKNAARKAAREVVSWKFRNEAWCAALDVTGFQVFGYATVELIGDVENKLSYQLIMPHKKS